MKTIIEFPTEKGESVFIEISEHTEADDRVSLSSRVVQKAEETLETALEKIKPITQTIIRKVRDASEAPQEVEVKFRIKMSAELGAVIASGESEVNYEVTLKWKSAE